MLKEWKWTMRAESWRKSFEFECNSNATLMKLGGKTYIIICLLVWEIEQKMLSRRGKKMSGSPPPPPSLISFFLTCATFEGCGLLCVCVVYLCFACHRGLWCTMGTYPYSVSGKLSKKCWVVGKKSVGVPPPPPPLAHQLFLDLRDFRGLRPFSFFFCVLVIEVVRWVPLLCVWEIEQKMLSREKSVGVPPPPPPPLISFFRDLRDSRGWRRTEKTPSVSPPPPPPRSASNCATAYRGLGREGKQMAGMG